jgi:D-sedoheptulose 7-phosphate isomerase
MANQNIDYVSKFLSDSIDIIKQLNVDDIKRCIDVILEIRDKKGRVFFAGSGGGAGHASHATCDFRKILGIESYSVSDNVSELTARVNDESWASAYANWLNVSNLSSNDALFVLSVGGGSKTPPISENLVAAIDFAKLRGSRILGIVGRDGGYLRENADSSVLIPSIDSDSVTAQTEGFQALIWHLMVTAPRLGGSVPMWESQS